jgi:hypothetical protein
MNTRKRKDEAQIAQLERAFQGDDFSEAENSESKQGAEKSARRRKAKGVSVLACVLSGTVMLGVGLSNANLQANVASTNIPMPLTAVPAIPNPFVPTYHDPHTIEGTAAIHKEMQSGTVNVSKSTITGIVDQKSMTASLYWTFVLKNHNNTDKEASVIIELPKNSALSRATLWINGHAQEASFSSNAQVQNAYDSIVVRHRDPLLVTQIAPNKIKVLAAPVTANGGEMKFRLGITAQAEHGANGATFVRLPNISESNLKFDSKQDIHFTSDTRLSGIGETEHAGIYTLRANIPSNEMKQAQIKFAAAAENTFASRLTHTNPLEYVKVTNVDGELNFERVSKKPDCRFITDEDTAFRLSNLWAHQEIERLASLGRLNDACDLANVYRIVSSVSGATVLEQDFDYSNNGLNRDLYRVINKKSSTGSDFTTVQGFVPYHESATNEINEDVEAQGGFGGGRAAAGDAFSIADRRVARPVPPSAPMAPMASEKMSIAQAAPMAVPMPSPTPSALPIARPMPSAQATRSQASISGINNSTNGNLFKLLACVMQACGFAAATFLIVEAILNKGLQAPVRLSRANTLTCAFLAGTAAMLAPQVLAALLSFLKI